MSASVFKITQSNNHFRKGGGIPERNKTWIPMCCPQGGEVITNLIVNSQKSRPDRRDFFDHADIIVYIMLYIEMFEKYCHFHFLFVILCK